MAGFEEDWLSRVRNELPGAQEYVEIFAKTMEGDVCTVDESEGRSPYFLLDVEILALILAGRLVGKGINHFTLLITSFSKNGVVYALLRLYVAK